MFPFPNSLLDSQYFLFFRRICAVADLLGSHLRNAAIHQNCRYRYLR